MDACDEAVVTAKKKLFAKGTQHACHKTCHIGMQSDQLEFPTGAVFIVKLQTPTGKAR